MSAFQLCRITPPNTRTTVPGFTPAAVAMVTSSRFGRTLEYSVDDVLLFWGGGVAVMEQNKRETEALIRAV